MLLRVLAFEGRSNHTLIAQAEDANGLAGHQKYCFLLWGHCSTGIVSIRSRSEGLIKGEGSDRIVKASL